MKDQTKKPRPRPEEIIKRWIRLGVWIRHFNVVSIYGKDDDFPTQHKFSSAQSGHTECGVKIPVPPRRKNKSISPRECPAYGYDPRKLECPQCFGRR